MRPFFVTNPDREFSVEEQSIVSSFQNANVSNPGHSTLILWRDAEQMINAYAALPDPVELKNHYGKIDGYNFDLDDLQVLIDPTTSGLTYPKADQFCVYFALNRGDLTIVIARVDSNNYVIKDFALEYCDPCPPSCAIR